MHASRRKRANAVVNRARRLRDFKRMPLEWNAMIAAFGIHIFYPVGEPPESGLQRIAALSEKWLSISRDVFKLNGPVFTHNMGSSLSQFDIEFAGPICTLKINGRMCFELAITSGVAAQQTTAMIDYFRATLGRYVCLSGSDLSDSASATIESAVANPSVLVIDHLVNNIKDEQKHALIQLGYHFVGAYYEYLTHNDGRTKPWTGVADPAVLTIDDRSRRPRSSQTFVGQAKHMKNSNSCPKCGSCDILLVSASSLKTKSNIIPIALTMPGCVGLSRYICGACGYSEEWIDDPNDIEKIRAKFPATPPNRRES